MRKAIVIALLTVYTISFGGYSFIAMLHEVAHLVPVEVHHHHSHGHSHSVSDHSSVLKLLQPNQQSKKAMTFMSMIFLMDAIVDQHNHIISPSSGFAGSSLYIIAFDSLLITPPTPPPVS